MLGSGKDLMSKGWISDLFHVYCFGCDPAVEPGVWMPCFCAQSQGFISWIQPCLSNPEGGVQFHC